ncbi:MULTISPECIES: SDR family oxidoreductase [Kitasatospora]|uniref:NAD(P)-dependent dehydrogenase (Short-subunit alcohol dehydrogenase family) n=2 Tax=Kitasatospora TaxID=2063 RepID=A0ABT1J4U7_9ACTN|nr:SDR family oxidoreductase [Kitasatospora paracochleata]MCP2312408.1 NAD(P)-dependent dehydrogenase (short-subunit alcohol dehydrogenase family) [Kitasatospora paracochleata]
MSTFAGTTAVVTGAGHGIGAALATALAAAGARVVVNDLDADAAHRVATAVDGIAVPGDAASEDGVAALITAARTALGRIDLYCANAGVAPVGGADADPDAWAQAWEVNVLAHVRASRLLLPEWLERGEGRFLATVSAAGLLTMLGSAPYAVSKHGALAYAEWLAATYRHRGLKVHALCPQGVRTRMLDGTGEHGQVLLAPTAIEPADVADTTLEAMAEDRFLILPHPEVADYYAARATTPERWLAGMNKLQQTVEAREATA